MQDFNIEFWNQFHDIFFDPTTHKYTDSFGTNYTSVTTFVGKFCEPFDAEGIAKKKAAKEGRDYRELLREWKDAGDYSCTLGTEVHAVMENLWQHKRYDPVFKTFIEKDILGDFNKRREKCYKMYEALSTRFIPIREELIVYDKDIKLCGTIDFLAYNPATESYVIFDYKSNKSIDKEPTPWTQKMKAPFDKYWDNNFYHYSLQLNLYKYILLKHMPEIKLDSMYLLHIPGKDDPIKSYKCVDLQSEITTLFNTTQT